MTIKESKCDNINIAEKYDKDKELRKALDRITESITELATQIAEPLARAVSEITKSLKPIVEAYMQYIMPPVECSNGRVNHLARYGKKHRTRKKNAHRAARLAEKEARRDKK